MRLYSFVLISSCAAALFVAAVGCVPSETPQEAPSGIAPPPPAPAQPAPPPPAPVEAPPAPPQAPEPAPAAAVAPENATPAPNTGANAPAQSGGEVQQLSVQSLEPLPGGQDASIQVAKVEGKLEYTVSGTFDLTGTITKAKPEDPYWHFLGNLTFPNSGYSLQDVYTNAPPGTEGNVIIFVPVTLPALNAQVTNEPVTHSIDFKLAAGNNASFVVLFTNP